MTNEPIAWMVYTLDGKSVCVTDNPTDFTPEHRALPLYTSPPAQRKPLTDEEIWKFWWSRPEVPDGEDDSMEAEFVAAVRAVLAAHGIKENKK